MSRYGSSEVFAPPIVDLLPFVCDVGVCAVMKIFGFVVLSLLLCHLQWGTALTDPYSEEKLDACDSKQHQTCASGKSKKQDDCCTVERDSDILDEGNPGETIAEPANDSESSDLKPRRSELPTSLLLNDYVLIPGGTFMMRSESGYIV